MQPHQIIECTEELLRAVGFLYNTRRIEKEQADSIWKLSSVDITAEYGLPSISEAEEASYPNCWFIDYTQLAENVAKMILKLRAGVKYQKLAYQYFISMAYVAPCYTRNQMMKAIAHLRAKYDTRLTDSSEHSD